MCSFLFLLKRYFVFAQLHCLVPIWPEASVWTCDTKHVPFPVRPWCILGKLPNVFWSCKMSAAKKGMRRNAGWTIKKWRRKSSNLTSLSSSMDFQVFHLWMAFYLPKFGCWKEVVSQMCLRGTIQVIQRVLVKMSSSFLISFRNNSSRCSY